MALIDYTDMQEDIQDAPEPEVLPKGTEVKARIVSVRTGVSDKNDCEYFSPVFEVPDQPMVKEFSSFFWVLDKEKLEPKAFQRSMYGFKNFAEAFGVDLTRPFDPETDLVGLEGWLIVGTRNDDEYGEQNTVKKYIAPK